MNYKSWLIVGAVLSLIVCPFINSQDASAINTHIGIELSKTCLAYHNNNLNTTCPTYEDILTVFPDTSNKWLSGEFYYNENGVYERQFTKFKNHFNAYRDFNRDVLWVDAPGDIREKIKRITITSAYFEYKIPSQVITNGSLQVGHSRFVSDKCDEAIITSGNWLFLLGDTMNYMLNGCDKNYTNFDEIRIIEWETQTHDLRESAKYKLEQWQREAIERCGKKICTGEETKFNPEGAG